MPKDLDKRVHIEETFRGYDLHRVNGVEADKSIQGLGCALGHRELVKSALASARGGFTPFVLVEDDVSFAQGTNTRISIPSDADAVFLGICSAFWGGYMMYKKDTPGFPHLCNIYNMLSAHAIYFASERYARAYERVLDLSIEFMRAGTYCPHDIMTCFMGIVYNVYSMQCPMLIQDSEFGGQENTRVRFGDVQQYSSASTCSNTVVKAKGREHTTRIKLLCNHRPDLNRLWAKMNGCDSVVVVGDDAPESDYEYCVVINGPRDISLLPEDKRRILVFDMEPRSIQVAKWYNEKSDFLFFGDHERFANTSEWHLSLTHAQFLETPSFPKSKLFSAVISGMDIMPGHKYRIKIAQTYLSYFDNLDVYGRNSTHLFPKNHLGELESHVKDAGIFPYRYHLAVENCSEHNYFTEKLIDGIMGECLCFYWGCPNIGQYFDSRSIIVLPSDDIHSCIRIIKEAIESNQYERRLAYIRSEKQKILNHYQFFARVSNIILLK